MTGTELDRLWASRGELRFATEAEARAYAASQPPGVIGVVPTTVTEPGTEVYDRRAAKLAETAERRRRRDEAMAFVRRERTRRVLRFVAGVWMLLCVTATAWFVYGVWNGHYTVRMTVPSCVDRPEPTI